MYGATWSLLLEISFKFFLKTIWKCLIQDGEEFPCHTVSNVIDLFPSVDCSTSKFPHLVYSYLCYHLTWQVNKIFRLEKKNKASRQPTSIWKFSRVIISVSLSCLLEDTSRACYLRTAGWFPPSWKDRKQSYLLQTSDFKTVSNRHEQRLLLRSKGCLVLAETLNICEDAHAVCYSVMSL